MANKRVYLRLNCPLSTKQAKTVDSLAVYQAPAKAKFRIVKNRLVGEFSKKTWTWDSNRKQWLIGCVP